MALSIGEQLRLAREARGIGLREICDQTRISVHYLEAIEANDYKRLPGGVFNRSFIKAYAKCVGYDEREAIEGYTRYLREHGDSSSDEVNTTPMHSKVYTDTPATRSPVLTVVLAILILALLTAGALAALHWFQKRAELSPSAGGSLWSAVACHRFGQSGAKSPHSKEALCMLGMYNGLTSATNDLGLHDYI